MKQKILYICFFIYIANLLSTANAQTVEATVTKDFTTANPPKTMSIRLLEPISYTKELTFEENIILNGNVIDVVSPKRLKRNASFSFQPTSYTDENGKTTDLNSDIVAKYKNPIDKKQLAKSTALGVGSFFVKGLSIGVAAVSGAVKNEDGNILKSAATSAYEATPISYVEKGKDIELTPKQIFYLKFPDIKDTDIDTNEEK